MASKLLRIASHEAENQQELSLRQAFELLEPKIRPPFPLTILNPQEYAQLNRAILYGVLCEPHLAKTHIKHLHAIVTDGYGFFVTLLVQIVNELYAKLVDSAKNQLIWVTKEIVDVCAIGVDGLLVCLLRQIIGGDFSEGNLWLCFELVSLFLAKWDCLLEEEPLVLTSALYTYLRLLSDHCRLLSNVKLEALKPLEIEFCVRVLRKQFHLCLKIGRDLIRLLQDLVHVPEFRALWKDLVSNPSEFRTPGFMNISQLYSLRTSSRYFLLRITPEMETQLRFLLTHVRFGSQKRYQAWFIKKFLFLSERETLIVDIVRFICCAHHPSNEIIQSDVIPRWAVIGWLLKSCRKNYIEANVKLALFYDWLFFDERVDNIMNVEPAMLLMICSIPKYMEMTHTLLEFLFLLVDSYDLDHNDIITKGVSSTFSLLVKKRVVHSLDVLTSCDALSPFLKERLGRFLSSSKVGVLREMQPAHPPGHSMSPVSLVTVSCMGTPTPSPEGHRLVHTEEDGFSTTHVDATVPISDDPGTTCGHSVVTSGSQVNSFLINRSQVNSLESLVRNLGETVKKSNTIDLQTLEAILLSFVNLDNQRPVSGSMCPEALSLKITNEYELNGYRLFAPVEFLPDVPDCDDEIGSATALIIRTFIFSQHKRMQEMLLFWSRKSLLVGARLLSYVSRLAYEAYVAGYLGNAMVDNNFTKVSDLGMPLLKFHVDGYFSFLNCRKEDSPEAIVFTSKMDKKFIGKLVDGAFAAYRCFLTYLRTVLHKEADTPMSKLFFSDLMSCSEWERTRVKFFFCSIFSYLPDLSASKEDIIRVLVGLLDHTDLVDMQFEIGLKKFSVFGDNTETILHLIKNSLNWDCLEQNKLWALIRSELAVSKVQVEKIILGFFCSNELDAKVSAIAVGGLLTLCSSCAPTPELVGAIMLLPNNLFLDFAATALATWAVSNASMLFESLAKFSEKLENENGDSILSNSAGIMVNRSAILWLLDYYNAHGVNGSNILSKVSVNITDKNAVQPP